MAQNNFLRPSTIGLNLVFLFPRPIAIPRKRSPIWSILTDTSRENIWIHTFPMSFNLSYQRDLAYSDCIHCNRVLPSKRAFLGTIVSDSETLVLELWEVWSISKIILPLSSLRLGLLVPSMGQKDLFENNQCWIRIRRTI